MDFIRLDVFYNVFYYLEKNFHPIIKRKHVPKEPCLARPSENLSLQTESI
jgi:hypothetical protein